MQDIINSFHIDIKAIIAQLINFGIVFFVLYKFAYKPLTKKMKERTDIIEKGLADAKESQEQLEQAEKIREDKLLEAKKEAKIILEDTQRMVENNKKETVEKAKKEAGKVVKEAREQIQIEKERMFKEVEGQLGQLVSVALGKVLKKNISAEEDQRLIKEALEEINNKS